MNLLSKQRDRENPSFANINMLGKCNADCYFCLGKDIEDILKPHSDNIKRHYTYWQNFDEFLDLCAQQDVQKIYLTGQNTDPLIYPWLDGIIDYIQDKGFSLGIRTNGLALDSEKLHTISTLKEEIGLSIHTLSPMTQKMMIGVNKVPNWRSIIESLAILRKKVRVSMVITRCNVSEFYDIVKYLSTFNLPYIQVRRVSTDTREKELMPDIIAYEKLYDEVSRIFPRIDKLWGDADVFDVFNTTCVFWRTIKTTVNSLNYFSDGTISNEYFIIEGYLKNQRRKTC